jgi:hypothetical protein
MKPLPFYRLFADIWEYLDFRRHKAEISCVSPDGLIKATLEQYGSGFTYTLTSGDDAKISTSIDIFRATAVRLRSFHTGSAKVALRMKRYLRTGDPKWLTVDRPFGLLHGGILMSNGRYESRGTKDDVDTDTWLDLVEDERLARLLDQADRLIANSSGDVDFKVQLYRSWELLKTIPEHHEYNVEVLRRRVQFVVFVQEFEDLPKAVLWARALVKKEPHDFMNWLNLNWIIVRHEGETSAVEVLQEALCLHGPDFTALYELATYLCSLKRLDEAKEAILAALKSDPFTMELALNSESFIPIRDFIAEQQKSEWYRKEKADWSRFYPSEESNR